jgi:hypothetical protein
MGCEAARRVYPVLTEEYIRANENLASLYESLVIVHCRLHLCTVL